MNAGHQGWAAGAQRGPPTETRSGALTSRQEGEEEEEEEAPREQQITGRESHRRAERPIWALVANICRRDQPS